MTKEQILKKAIEKAVKNGYKLRKGWVIDPACMIVWPKTNNATEPYSVIFSHDFAKAFWGEKPFKHLGARVAYSLAIGVRINYDRGVPAWIYHIQKMVIHPDPIKYLEKFL